MASGRQLDDVVLPKPLPAFTPDHLSDEQLDALDKGPGRVVTPVELERFTDPLDLNNFALYFSDEGSIAGVIYQRIRCNRRFAIVYPDLTEFLRANFLVLRDSGVSSADKAQVLLRAYDLMAGLVDRDDPGVVGADGRINGRYLWQ